MKILMVSSFLPYPLLSGGNVRLYNLLKYLSKNNDITLICEKRAHQTQSDIEKVNQLVSKVITVKRRKQWTLSNILKSLFSTKAFLIVGHTSKEMKNAIKNELESTNYDLIHIETSYVYQNLPKTTLPKFLTEHNIEYLIYKRYADKKNFIIRPFLYWDVLKLKKNEENFWRDADKVAVVSEKDREVVGEKNSVVIPNGADLEKFRAKKTVDEKIKKLLFMGDFVYIQNQDSAVWLINNFWPRFTKNFPKATLWIVGKRIPDKIKKLKKEGIMFDENAPPEAEKILERSDIMLAPIRVGGGTNLKILEAMASGTPVITTPIGNEGIQAELDKEILIADTAEQFVEKAGIMFSDNDKYDYISKNSRIFIEKNYNWEKIAHKLEDFYKNLLAQ